MKIKQFCLKIVLVPQGLLRIARQFIAGKGSVLPFRPVGTIERLPFFKASLWDAIAGDSRSRIAGLFSEVPAGLILILKTL
jgi:hypothetical protein